MDVKYVNPLIHECMTFNNFEKYDNVRHDILMLVNFTDVFSNFLNHTEDFLYNI